MIGSIVAHREDCSVYFPDVCRFDGDLFDPFPILEQIDFVGVEGGWTVVTCFVVAECPLIVVGAKADVVSAAGGLPDGAIEAGGLLLREGSC